jgi:hypothetical protein
MRLQKSDVFKAVLASVPISLLALAFMRDPHVSCHTLEPRPPVMSSHGFRVWYGDSFITEEHRGERICVPEDWRAIGTVREGDGWVQFKDGGSAILARTDLFTEDQVVLSDLDFPLVILSPHTMSPQEYTPYKETILAAFSDIARLYPRPSRTKPHTILITVGVGGAAQTFEDTLYPDPSSEVSMFVRDRTHKRSTELFIHAIAHLFNRYAEDDRQYLNVQSPFPPSDFEEMEAAWSEVAFLRKNAERRRRVSELYAIHQSIAIGTSTGARIYPFDDSVRVSELRVYSPIVPEGSSYIDYQYGHYVLAPLIMIGIEGMLHERGASTTVQSLLSEIHHDPTKNFLTELRDFLSDADLSSVTSWINDGVLVPETYLTRGLSFYEQYTDSVSSEKSTSLPIVY